MSRATGDSTQSSPRAQQTGRAAADAARQSARASAGAAEDVTGPTGPETTAASPAAADCGRGAMDSDGSAAAVRRALFLEWCLRMMT